VKIQKATTTPLPSDCPGNRSFRDTDARWLNLFCERAGSCTSRGCERSIWEPKLKVEEEGIRSELRRSRDRRARIRKAGGDIERIRKAVSNRIADGMSEIDEKHPSLGTHLRGAIRTGTICFYRPKKPVPWSL